MKRNREKSRCVFFLVSWAVLQIPAIAIDPGYHDKSPAKKTIQGHLRWGYGLDIPSTPVISTPVELIRLTARPTITSASQKD